MSTNGYSWSILPPGGSSNNNNMQGTGWQAIPCFLVCRANLASVLEAISHPPGQVAEVYPVVWGEQQPWSGAVEKREKNQQHSTKSS